MATIAVCAHCSSELFFLEHPTTERRALCPECGSEFCVGQVNMRTLSAAQLLPEAVLTEPILPRSRILPDSDSLAEPETDQSSVSPIDLNLSIESQSNESAEANSQTLAESPNVAERPTLAEIAPTESSWHQSTNAIQGRSETNSFAVTDWVEEPIPQVESEAVDEKLDEMSDEFSNNLNFIDEPEQEDAPNPVHSSKGTHRPRQGFPVLATLFGIAVVLGGGLFGQYALLWLRGPNADFLQLAQHLPNVVLPTSMQESAATEPGSDSHRAERIAMVDEISAPQESHQKPIAEKSSPAAAASVKHDSQVQPASATIDQSPQPVEVAAELLAAPQVTPAEFFAALEMAQAAQPKLIEGDLSTRESVVRKGQAFIEMCHLAEKYAFVDSNIAATTTQVLLTKELFQKTLADIKTRDELAQITTRWLAHPRRSTAGIFFVGQVVDIKTNGPWYENRLLLESKGVSQEIHVVTDKFRYSIGQQIGVVGTLVTDPQQHLAGYQAQSQVALSQQTLSQVQSQGDGSPAEASPTVVLEKFSYDLNKSDTQVGGDGILKPPKQPKSVYELY